ncbi:hypothetical protein G4B84_010483 [Aspergillus flavus NRRL3357]|nr:uncharacterized protein G4B84_010483 [Aspergillus flavus NRRL3357]QMW34992.1 hypothetical protein G4B84_010483 [Aspergillus flavus NRRL3357]QMW37533.1 hypothetical protein G4B11_000769 [Aspergillus flavus]
MRAWKQLSTNLPLEKGMKLVEDEPYPLSPNPTQVLVRVKSIAVNPADPTFAELGWLVRSLVRLHPIPGMDFSGEVVATGSNVTSVNPGDRVFGRVDTQKGQAGCMAEYTRAEIEGCMPIPPGIDWDHAAGAGTAAITAYESLVLNSNSGDLVFINGGAGGVGTFAIQFAKAHGCRVIVSCSTAKIGICKELGADEVIDYQKEDLVSVLKEKGKVIDLVVDYAYREEMNLYKASDDFLADGATFVMVPGGLSSAILRVVSKNSLCPHMLGGGKAKFKAYFAKSNRTAFQQISEWMAAGKVRTVIDSVFEFDDMPRAIERIKSGRTFKTADQSIDDIRKELPPNEDAEKTTARAKTRIRELCGLFLVVIDRKVYLFHQTAREFLVKRQARGDTGAGRWKHSLSPEKSHYLLAEICTLYLSRFVALPGFMDYAADFWAVHFRRAAVSRGDPIAKRGRKLCRQGSEVCQKWAAIYKRSRLKFPDSNDTLIASYLGLTAIVEILLQTEDIDVDSKDSNGRTPLSWAAENGYEMIVKLLLDTGRVDVESKDSEYGRTPLSWAAENGHERVVKWLLDTGRMDVESKDSNGRTPLSWAAENGHEGVVKLLHRANLGNRDCVSEGPVSASPV